MRKLSKIFISVAAFASLTANGFADDFFDSINSFDSFSVYDSTRSVEFGYEGGFGMSGWKIQPFDLMADTLGNNQAHYFNELISKGLVDSFHSQSRLFASVRNKSKNKASFRLDFFMGTETSGLGWVSEADVTPFMNATRESNNSDNFKKAQVHLRQDMFFTTGAAFGLKLNENKIQLRAGVDLFKPLLYAKANGSESKDSKKTDGSLTIYSFDNYDKIRTGKSEGYFSDLFKGMGFDISLFGDMAMVKQIRVGSYMRVPLMPGVLFYEHEGDFAIGKKGRDFAKELFNGSADGTVGFDADALSTKKTEYWISRPFRWGVTGSWVLAPNFLDIYALVGLGVRYPYSNDATLYAEYKAGARLQVNKVFATGFYTGWLDQLCVNELATMVNLKFAELDFAVSFQSRDILGSLFARGVGARVCVKAGF